jgi:hypothetical protein
MPSMYDLEPSRRSFSTKWLRVSVTLVLAATAWLGAGGRTVEASVPALSVHVYCYSNPERVVVHNNRSFAITINSVGSRYQPYSNEPIWVGYRLAAGKSVTFYSGNGASYSNPRTLTRRYIFNNTVGSVEGARVKRSNGTTYSDRCG